MKTDIAKMDMCIEPTSMSLVIESLRTFPIIPYEGKVTFFANRIQEPKWSRENEERQKNDEKYISECLSLNVIPFSSISLEYREDEKLFIPKAYDHNSLILCRKDSIDALLEGGKIHKINLETSKHNEGFKIFRENFLQTLIDKEYVLDNFNLCLTMLYHNPNSTFKFNVGTQKKGLILHLGSEVSEDTEKLENWFKNIRAYQD